MSALNSYSTELAHFSTASRSHPEHFSTALDLSDRNSTKDTKGVDLYPWWGGGGGMIGAKLFRQWIKATKR